MMILLPIPVFIKPMSDVVLCMVEVTHIILYVNSNLTVMLDSQQVAGILGQGHNNCVKVTVFSKLKHNDLLRL